MCGGICSTHERFISTVFTSDFLINPIDAPQNSASGPINPAPPNDPAASVPVDPEIPVPVPIPTSAHPSKFPLVSVSRDPGQLDDFTGTLPALTTAVVPTKQLTKSQTSTSSTASQTSSVIQSPSSAALSSDPVDPSLTVKPTVSQTTIAPNATTILDESSESISSRIISSATPSKTKTTSDEPVITAQVTGSDSQQIRTLSYQRLLVLAIFFL